MSNSNRDWPEHEFSNTIESSRDRRIIRWVALFICVSIAGLVLWSTQAEVEEISKSKGQIVPLGHKRVIQSEHGGTIFSVDAQEGGVVSKGESLVHFSSVVSVSTKEELEAKKANLEMKLLRFDAFMRGTTPDFSKFDSKYSKLISSHLDALNDMNKKRDAIIRVTAAEIAKTQAEVSGLLQEEPVLRSQLKSSKDELDMMSQPGVGDAVSEVQRLDTKQKYESLLRQVKVLKGKHDVLNKTLVHLQQQSLQKKAELVAEVSEKRTEVQTELIQAQARLRKNTNEVKADTVRTPVDGVIQSIPSKSVGSVVKPGGTVAVIVPMTKQGLMETKLSPRDVGFVRVGDVARIKIDAFDYSRYGTLLGIVTHISPTTDQDERGGVYYKVKIAIEKPYFTKGSTDLKTIPGMTGEADIITGKKTVFEYLWKPVFTNVTGAFGER
ncbi:secretion protein HylD [Vibrio sp. UCD-FRSSP16_10]|uniref:HlyD family type I secretion periplasmic adaptor subunit n=1 Tax=unclassified Vibrio TaxID=2614977 RepID=UPI0007FD1225|nr:MULTISPECIES: HlyD family type I secretion periplasmic adaptor subunit [unclassified Vibrio]OBT16807.1 secretion protein HylD [Vibrio sp. UCD-FRSSP16_30]OBT21434.1 secretion protein HylD [Vibrio sp. UCD-FRSSP16_10]